MKPSGVRVLSCSAFRGSDRFTPAVSIRQRHPRKWLPASLQRLHISPYRSPLHFGFSDFPAYEERFYLLVQAIKLVIKHKCKCVIAPSRGAAFLPIPRYTHETGVENRFFLFDLANLGHGAR